MIIMIKRKNIALDTKEINNLIADLELIKENLEKAQRDIPKEVATIGKRYLDMQYQSMINDVSIEGKIETSVKSYKNGCSLVASGDDVVYIEFGTGEEGAKDGHPEKMDFRLNPYNSGPIVSTHVNKNGEHYWFYKGQYTQGIPSGKQMYNTRLYLENQVVKKVIKEKASDVLSKI